jgi:hypothetical protein
MANLTSNAGFVRITAGAAHAFLREQVLTIFAPIYLFQYRRASARSAGDVADARTCGPNRAIDLQPTGIGRS